MPEPVLEKQEEVVTPAGEAAKVEVTPPPEVKEEPPVESKEEWQGKIQKRIDGLVAERELEKRNNELLRRELDELRAKKPVETKPVTEEWTIERTRAALIEAENGNPEYVQHKVWLQEKMSDLKVEQKMAVNRVELEKQRKAHDSYQKAIAEFPEFKDEASELRKTADSIFSRYRLENAEDNIYLAAKTAFMELNSGKVKSASETEKQLAKATAQTSLATGASGKTSPTDDAILETLQKKAESSGDPNDWANLYKKRKEVKSKK